MCVGGGGGGVDSTNKFDLNFKERVQKQCVRHRTQG